MSGGTTQLIAIGNQDVHLTGKPEVSFFQTSYKRYTNFTQVVDRQLIQGNPASGGISTIRFEKKGDLLGYTYIAMNNGTQAETVADWTSIIDKVEFYIGGSLVDTHDSVFSSNLAVDLFATCVSKSALASQAPGNGVSSYFYPLRFFFCESTQNYLPLVALNYHDIEIRITWKTVPANKQFEIFSNFVYLDNDEREWFANKSHMMLITQIQKSQPSQLKVQDLVFNHPIKYLCAETQNGKGAWCSASNRIKLQLNGNDISDFKFVQPCFVDASSYYHSPYNPGTNKNFLYPFCLDTSKSQPTGSVNFSRLDTARLISEKVEFDTVFYGVNYNILKIENGLAGQLYSN